jgi:hypothetical protein
MTPRELIDMLGRWDQDRPLELVISNRPVDLQGQIDDPKLGPPHSHVVCLMQGTNTINLSEPDR